MPTGKLVTAVPEKELLSYHPLNVYPVALGVGNVTACLIVYNVFPIGEFSVIAIDESTASTILYVILYSIGVHDGVAVPEPLMFE